MFELLSFWSLAIFLNAAFGVACFEWAWKKMHRFRHPNQELFAAYPAFYREDATSWQKWKFYPGAMTLMLPRILCFIIFPTMASFWLKLLMCGHPSGAPRSGMRKTLVDFNYRFHTFLTSVLACGTILSWKRLSSEDVDNYSEYLGTVEEQTKC